MNLSTAIAARADLDHSASNLAGAMEQRRLDVWARVTDGRWRARDDSRETVAQWQAVAEIVVRMPTAWL